MSNLIKTLTQTHGLMIKFVSKDINREFEAVQFSDGTYGLRFVSHRGGTTPDVTQLRMSNEAFNAMIQGCTELSLNLETWRIKPDETTEQPQTKTE